MNVAAEIFTVLLTGSDRIAKLYFGIHAYRINVG